MPRAVRAAVLQREERIRQALQNGLETFAVYAAERFG
jgi:uncharacterized MAPEG superfamily protein